MMLRDIISRIGILRAEETDGYITGLYLIKEPVPREREASGLLLRLEAELNDYFSGNRTAFDLPIRESGTCFQKKVWHALRQIPYGEVRSYGEIADAVGVPGAARAVGAACHRNPVMLLTPCHRVIGASGDMTGFGGGIMVKEALLTLEGHRISDGKLKKQEKSF